MPKCPKCGKEVALKKSWKMAGRADKAGKRVELTIGLCECCGKTFRMILSKQKIGFSENQKNILIFLRFNRFLGRVTGVSFSGWR